MKVTELREKLRNLEKAELQALIVEMYLDALINTPVQFKEKRKSWKQQPPRLILKH